MKPVKLNSMLNIVAFILCIASSIAALMHFDSGTAALICVACFSLLFVWVGRHEDCDEKKKTPSTIPPTIGELIRERRRKRLAELSTEDFVKVYLRASREHWEELGIVSRKSEHPWKDFFRGVGFLVLIMGAGIVFALVLIQLQMWIGW